ncbi:putative membrane protein YkoI [Microbacterium sp. 1154]|uniref:PepSY domain-containing protein n=1 Tax=Microbacterium sp. 1154 TaxID=2817733 RepID=UPI0028614C9A|nr:PepSY domain-containing protein [Microbacterium sp. 1154]MDR6690188.1 putative membrane protein YkoI [Microbacterium sp. 1154]
MAPSRSSAAALLLAASALAMAGCTPTTPAGDAATNDREAVRAITTAESRAGGRAFQLEAEDGAWEVHVASGDREVEVRVSADGGEVRSSSDSGALDADDGSALAAAGTTLADAVRIAAAQGTGGAVDEAELQRDGTTATWSIDLAGGVTVRVSAADGSVG